MAKSQMHTPFQLLKECKNKNKQKNSKKKKTKTNIYNDQAND